MARRPAPAALVAAGLLVLAAASCTGGGETSASSTQPTDEAPAASTTLRDDLPVVGGTLRLGVGRLESLDPADASPESVSSAIAADLLFDGLTEVRAGDAAARPALAARWDTADRGRTWRFTLRPDARFSDGSALTATDVERSIERVVREGVASLSGSRLEALLGYDDFVAGTTADLAGVRVADASTLEVQLEVPLATLPELLASPTFGVVSGLALDATNPSFAEAPSVTSGPFRFASRDGDVIRLVRTTDGDAYLDGVDLHQHDDLATAYDTFAAGGLDWSLVPPSRVDAAAEDHGVDGFVPFQAELFFGFNLAQPEFADVRFRQAIMAAVDREAVVNAVYFGIARPLSVLIPEGVPGHDARRCGDGCAYDPPRAEQLLESAFPTGTVPTVYIDYDDGVDEAAVAGIIEENLEAVGIPATLRPHPAGAFGAFLTQGQGALVRLGWVAVAPTGDAYLAPLFASGSPDNVTGLADPSVDELLAAATAAVAPRERERLLGEAESAILALAPVVPLAQFQILSVAGDAVHDLDLAINGTFDPDAVWLSP
ncbi:MAG: ABC transporter substrate-binding protein [Acidimicrobiia bacterium]|nr:ABC transporter substrate-binding protein [Acidimicrobiia bacterium]